MIIIGGTVIDGTGADPRVAAITIFGASGAIRTFADRRDRVVIRRSSRATPAASSTASATAAPRIRAPGAFVL